MQFENIDPSIVLVIVGFVAVVILIIILILTRYKTFRPNEYVIWLRRGKVKRASSGGSAIVLPVFDEIIIIPTTVQQTLLEARERVVSKEYQDLSITAYIYWRVINPEVAFSKVSWDKNASDYVERVIKNAAESILRTTCANMAIETVIRERNELIKQITAELHQLMSDWGITTESVEIKDVEVLDKDLKDNLEATKRIEEEQKARMRNFEKEEKVRMRTLEIDRLTGVQDQTVKMEIEVREKDRQVLIAQREQERANIEAETRRQVAIIDAEARREVTITGDIRVEVERMTQEAEARKISLIAQAEGEAAGIKQKLVAEAEGLLEQVKALQQADERFVQLKTLEILPEMYKNVKVDNMMILGEGQDAFKAIAQLVLPFMNIVKEMSATKESSKSKK